MPIPCVACGIQHTYAEWHTLGMLCPLCLTHTTKKWRAKTECQASGGRHNHHHQCPGASCRLEPERHG